MYFKPRGIPLRELEHQEVTMEGFEAIRLVDCEGMQQQEAADMMGISRPTLSRVLSEARKAVATALAHGRAIQIDGGAFHYADDDKPGTHTPGGENMPGYNGSGRCGSRQGCGNGQGKGRGQGQGRNRRQNMQRETPMNKTRTLNTRTIAVTSEGPTLESAVDPRFGRAAGFIVVNTETMDFTYIDNGASQAMAQGAGIQAAEIVANSGAKALLTGYVGPKAFTALSAVGMAVGQDVDGMTVKEAVLKFKSGGITMADTPNSESGANK